MLVLAALAAGAASAGTLESRLAWVDGKPQVELLVTAPAVTNPPAVQIPLALFDAKDNRLWSTQATVNVVGAPPWKTVVPVLGATNLNQQHRLELTLREPLLGIDCVETLFFANPDAPLRAYGFRRQGEFPNHKVFFTAAFQAFKGTDLRSIPVNVAAFDTQENKILSAAREITPGNQPSWHSVDISPESGRKAVGPFRAEIEMQSDVYGINFNAIHTFPYPNAMVPVTGMEHGDRGLWFAAAGNPMGYVSLQMYYSPQLCELVAATNPVVVFDLAEKHSGRQSLRVDYPAGGQASAWARQWQPGKPSMLTVWVKGNGTADRLVVTFEDFINHTLPAWQRNANFSTETVCTLDFAGWRRFRVPTLGDGMQQTGIKGSSLKIDAPIGIMAFTVLPGPKRPEGQKPGDLLHVWIDDIGAETQTGPDDLLSMELQASNADGELTPDGVLYVSVGNGFPAELKQGRLAVTAKDGRGETVYTTGLPLPVLGEAYASGEIPLKELAAKNPRGPVEVDVAFTDPATPGARVTRRATFKRADQGGLIFDFETAESYSGYIAGRVTTSSVAIVKGGADGAGNALAMPVVPGNTNTLNSVLLHPSLPGLVDRVEMMVKGSGKPVKLQPWFIDSGFSGIWLRPHNLFVPEPITVDWQDWRKVTFKAPPIPAYHGDKTRYFLYKPWYPLNLALAATVATNAEPTQIFLDNIRVLTHLPDHEELRLDVEYPDETHIHGPGMPLHAVVCNYGPTERALKLSYELLSYQGVPAGRGDVDIKLLAGARQKTVLLPTLDPGIYELRVTGLGAATTTATVITLKAADYFGAEPLKTLLDPVQLRRLLGLMTEKVYLDWDNSEPVPNTLETGWFEGLIREKNPGNAYRIVPIVGFSSDWAGVQTLEALNKELYERTTGNLYQMPARLVDWSTFTRECLREYKGRFDEWVCWENPDLEDAPQSLPPEIYTRMLSDFYRWVKLYDPKAKVTAGGFNFNRFLQYLDRCKEPDKLPCDEFAVQMNIGELSPEGADMEGFLDELNRILKLPETGRKVQTSELDWGIGPFLSPLQQSAYHTRASLILSSRGAAPHQFSLANTGLEFNGYGVFYRMMYGNTPELQTFKPFYVPKPAFFALIEIRKFLGEWSFVQAVNPSDRRLDDNRAFLFRNSAGEFTTVLWRAVEGERSYRLPATWTNVVARDAFGFPVRTETGIRCTPLPFFLRFPAGTKLEQLVHDLRMLETADGSYPVALDLVLDEPDSVARAAYSATGQTRTEPHAGILPGGRRLRKSFVTALQTETFTFTARTNGNALLRRTWYFDAGQKLSVKLNDGAPQTWDLTEGQGNEAGVRESTFVLRSVKDGPNTVAITYEKPGNCAGYRAEPFAGDFVPLATWGVLNARQTRGDIQAFRSAVGTPLRIGKQDYTHGIGAHAVSFIEYPLDGQFKSFEVTAGIDGQTEGRGSVVFRILVDGKEKANSGIVNGFTKPVTLKVDDLAGARRLILSVMDGGDGNNQDLADWVDGKLFLK